MDNQAKEIFFSISNFNSIYNVIPKVRDLLIFPNYLMHTAYPFNINGERRSFSFNVKLIYNK